MRRLMPAFALLFALVLALPARSAAQSETENVDRTLTLPAGGTVRLKTFSGKVNITAGGGEQVVIRAVRRASPDRLRDIRLEIQQNGNTIDIDANHRVVERRNDNVVETDFEIQVPSRASLDLRTFSAPVTVTGVSGNIVVDGFSSEIHLNDVSGPLRIKTFSGDIALRLSDAARGDIEFDSFSGRFNSDLPVAMTSAGRRNFRGSLNGGGGTDFKFETFSGSVTIRR